MNVKANQVSDAFKLSQQLASLHACVRMDDGESVYASKWYSTAVRIQACSADKTMLAASWSLTTYMWEEPGIKRSCSLQGRVQCTRDWLSSLVVDEKVN